MIATVTMDEHAYALIKELLQTQFGGVTDPNRVRRNRYFVSLEAMILEYEDQRRQAAS